MKRTSTTVILWVLFSWPCIADTLGVPVPILGFDPNEGQTAGVILAIVTDTDGKIERIMAPAVATNTLNGTSFDFNYFGFPSEDARYFLYFSHTTKNYWGYTVRYRQRNLWGDWLDFWGEGSFNRSPVNRFYGFGPDVDDEEASDYVLKEVRLDLQLSVRPLPAWKINFNVYVRPTWISRGVARDIDKLEDNFPNIPGGEGAFIWAPWISLEYDTRDSEVTPSSGLYTRLFFKSSLTALGSEATFLTVGFEGQAYWPHWERLVLAVRVLAEYMPLKDEDTPFYERSMLGGAKTLRGFGQGRFYDWHRALINIEERIRIYRWDVANVQLDIEGALFCDLGQVFHSFSTWRLQDTQVVGGVGIRLVVRDQIAAKVDIGYGAEGASIFAGLDYPF